LAKAHYPELDLDLITSGILESNEDEMPVDEAAIRQRVLGYDQLYALGTQLNVYYEAYDLPGSPSQLRRLSLWLLMVLMAAVTRLLLPQSLELCPAL
jgi:hypothetical protein